MFFRLWQRCNEYLYALPSSVELNNVSCALSAQMFIFRLEKRWGHESKKKPLTPRVRFLHATCLATAQVAFHCIVQQSLGNHRFIHAAYYLNRLIWMV